MKVDAKDCNLCSFTDPLHTFHEEHGPFMMNNEEHELFTRMFLMTEVLKKGTDIMWPVHALTDHLTPESANPTCDTHCGCHLFC
jgi:hypothetical protein